MYVSRNDRGEDKAYVVTLLYPHKNTVEIRSGITGMHWTDPKYPYIKCLDAPMFEALEGLALEPGEGPIEFVLSRIERVNQEVVEGPTEPVLSDLNTLADLQEGALE